MTPKQIQNLRDSSDGDTDLVDGYDELPPEFQEKIDFALEHGHVPDEDWKGVGVSNSPRNWSCRLCLGRNMLTLDRTQGRTAQARMAFVSTRKRRRRRPRRLPRAMTILLMRSPKRSALASLRQRKLMAASMTVNQRLPLPRRRPDDLRRKMSPMTKPLLRRSVDGLPRKRLMTMRLPRQRRPEPREE